MRRFLSLFFVMLFMVATSFSCRSDSDGTGNTDAGSDDDADFEGPSQSFPCESALECIEECGTFECLDACIDYYVCPETLDEADSVFDCVDEHCPTVCPDFSSAECEECAETQCLAEIKVCEASSCS